MEDIYWEQFLKTGEILDYLQYKNDMVMEQEVGGMSIESDSDSNRNCDGFYTGGRI